MMDSLIFALSLLGINILIFIPSWLIGVFSKIENSKKAFLDDSPFYIFKKSFYIRHTDDCLRLIFEIQVVSLFVLFSNIAHSYFLKYLLLIIVTFSFVYVTYVGVITKVFKKTPILINDLEFAKTGLIFYKKKIPLIILTCLLMLLGVVFISNNLIDILFDSSNSVQQKWPLIVVLCLSILLSIVSIRQIGYNLYHNCVSFSIIKHFTWNLKKCSELKSSLKNLNTNFPYEHTKQIKLKERPNILLIFLESYGSFTLSNEQYGAELKKRLGRLNESLIKSHWSSLSCLSESPVASGGSWLSHSSVIFGAKVKDIAAHELIFSSTDYPTKLTSLPKLLSRQGYNTTLASSVSHGKNEVNWSKLKNSYPFEDLMLIDKFKYTGKKVSISGNTYTLPDEYTLNYSYNSIADEAPFFLCFSTTNSHYNFISPLETLEHWEDYNTKDFALTDGLKNNNLKNYFTAINYQFEGLDNFFTNQNPDNTIVILIGDHQPPLITPSNIDKATPIHIISKNKDFLNVFEKFNYTEGLVPNAKVNTKHESFFSKFLYALNKVYGTDKDLDLPIFEEGIDLY